MLLTKMKPFVNMNCTLELHDIKEKQDGKDRKSFSYCKPLLYAYCNIYICDISIISIALIYTLILFPSCIIFSVIKLNIQTTIYHAMKVNGDQGRLQSPFTFIKRTAWTFTRSDRQTLLVYHDKVKLNQLWNY